ncbi:MAG: lysoplasmalogenase [Burkholderiaceae bacterium]|nr:lysoplasmalogenase [Burkholderiaceae bacterium]
MLSPFTLTTACLFSVLVFLAVDRLEWPAGRVIAKLTASSCFVGVAVSLGAQQSIYGQLILGALVLGWLGDALLLSRAPKAFMGGLGAFLLSHLLFAAAFVSGGWSLPAMGVAAAVAVAFGAGVLRWLLPHTPKEFKAPVLAYVVVILAMCIAATGHAVASRHWAVLVGALLFTASDLSVARDRFVRQGFVNRLWGWPTYFVAQLVLAWTVAAAAGAV